VILAWAFTAILGKLISLPSLDMVVWRTGLATLGFVAIALAGRAPRRLAKREAGILFGLGAILGLHWVLFFLAARLATASVSLAAMPTMLIWCTLMEPFVNGTRHWSRIELILGMVIIAAVWMIYAVELKLWFGFTIGIVSALIASVYAIFNKQVVARYHFATLCAWQLGGACVAAWLLLPFISGTALPAMPGARDLGWIVLFAIGCTVLPYAAFVYVMKRMSVFTVNVVYNLEPLYGMALATLIFGVKEQMTPGFYAGAAIIIASVLAVPWLQRRAF
jgi:drug/metabolite transporter (DMT)-like permease